jgi:hypothetical protein
MLKQNVFEVQLWRSVRNERRVCTIKYFKSGSKLTKRRGRRKNFRFYGCAEVSCVSDSEGGKEMGELGSKREKDRDRVWKKKGFEHETENEREREILTRGKLTDIERY